MVRGKNKANQIIVNSNERKQQMYTTGKKKDKLFKEMSSLISVGF